MGVNSIRIALHGGANIKDVWRPIVGVLETSGLYGTFILINFTSLNLFGLDLGGREQLLSDMD